MNLKKLLKELNKNGIKVKIPPEISSFKELRQIRLGEIIPNYYFYLNNKGDFRMFSMPSRNFRLTSSNIGSSFLYLRKK